MNAIKEEEIIVFASIPDDRDLLALLGEVSIRHSQHDYALKMCLRSLTSLTVEEVLKATQHQGSSELRSRIRKVAKKVIGEGRELCLVDVLLNRSKNATERRNYITHGVWGTALDGPNLMYSNSKWDKPPSNVSLQELAKEFEDITRDLNNSRRDDDGFLKKILDKNLKK